jgi:hypothetical protein
MMASRFTRTIARKFSTQPNLGNQLGKLEVRVGPYGLEKFPLNTLGKLEENRSGWEFTPFDRSISKSLRRGLEDDVEKLGMRVYFDTKSETLKVVPKKDRMVKKFAKAPSFQYTCDADGFVVEDIDDDSLFSKRFERFSKAFEIVDSNHIRKRSKNGKVTHSREKQILDTASELDISSQLSQRLARIAMTNKKAMRQMLKRITAQATDSLQLSFSK